MASKIGTLSFEGLFSRILTENDVQTSKTVDSFGPIQDIIEHFTISDVALYIDSSRNLHLDVKRLNNLLVACLNLSDQELRSFVFPESLDPSHIEKSLCGLISVVHKWHAVPGFPGREDIGFLEKDFVGFSSRALEGITIFIQLLSIMNRIESALNDPHIKVCHQKFMKFVTTKVLLVSGEHFNEHELWTTKECSHKSKKLLSDLLKVSNVQTVEQLLFGDHGYLKAIWNEIKSKLTRDSWKENPSAVSIFSFCNVHIHSPLTGENLDQLLPPALLLIDDHENSHKIKGIECLTHIIRNCSAAELRWFGRADVLYEALQHALYNHDAEVLTVSLPCMLSILQVIERATPSSNTSEDEMEQTKMETILQRLLYDMQLENNLASRRVYASFLPQFIDAMGIRVVGNLKKLLEVVYAFLEIHDGSKETARFHILDVLLSVLKIAWPRIPHHFESIMEALLKFLYDIAMDNLPASKATKEALFQKCRKCVQLLGQICPDKVEICMQQLVDVKTIPLCDNWLALLISDCSTK